MVCDVSQDEVKARQLSGLLQPRVVVPQDAHSNEVREGLSE